MRLNIFSSPPSPAFFSTILSFSGARRPTTCCVVIFPYPMAARSSSPSLRLNSWATCLKRPRLPVFGESQAEFLKIPLTQIPPQGNALLPLLGLYPLEDLGLGPRGPNKFQPISARMVFGRGDDFHRVAVLQLIIERYQPAVHLRPHALMPDIRMNAVGKIDGGGTFGKLPHLALGSKYVYLGGKEIHLDRLEELPIVLQVRLPLQQLPQPRKRFSSFSSIFPFSLYFQWAAIPCSDIWCISHDLIWISILSP